MRDRESPNHAETAIDQPPAAAVEEPARAKFAGGEVPPVHAEKHGADGAAAPAHTASEKAYAEDDHERELKTKVGALVQSKFGGDYKKAFEHYDADKSGSVDKNELVQLLADAGVGSGITRGTWAKRIIEKLDSNADGAIEWSEFESVFASASA